MNDFASYRTPRRSSSRKKQQESILIVLLGAFLSFVCVGMAAFAVYLSGYNPLVLPFQITASAMAERNAACQAVINKAIEASGGYCGETGSNKVCYGNTTIRAELSSDATQPFAQRGDIVAVNQLVRLSASPLNLNNSEWGIAVFKVIANLPRSLPGETVTMIVFGNTTLDNASGNMESFYFFSDLGQITCEAVPFDGMMITAPDGGGIKVHVNGAELTLMGKASLKATKNGNMEVTLLSGSGRIVSNGREQYFGAGEKVRVGLGGENGLQSITDPSAPEPLTQEELNTACSVTGQFCSPGEVIPVSAGEAQQQLESAITFTPTSIFTPTFTSIPSATGIPTNTAFVIPSFTPRRTATPTRTNTPIRTPTRIPTQTNLPTATRTNTPTANAAQTSAAQTAIAAAAQTSAAQTAAAQSATVAAAQTAAAQTAIVAATQTAIAAAATQTAAANATATAVAVCGSLSAGPLTNSVPNELAMDIINNSALTVTIDSVHAEWVKIVSPSQKLDKLLLGGNEIWNISDNTPPSDIPNEGSWKNGADRTIPNATTRNLVVQFGDSGALEPGTYQVQIVFDFGCQGQVTGSIPIP